MGFDTEELGKYVEVLSGFAFKSKDFSESGIPVIKIKNINPPEVSLHDVSYVPVSFLETHSKYVLDRNDILIAMTGSHINQWASVVGRVARVKYKEKSFLNQRVGKIIVTDTEKCDENFVYYYLSQDTVKIELANIAGGAANQANISPADIKGLRIPFPSIDIQRRIGEILSAYDDLIENNKKQINLLEEMAQRLYKEWFVDLHFPGYEDVEIVDGVPKGWERKKIGEVVVTLSGGTPSRNHAEYYEKGTHLWLKTKELNDGYIFDTEEKITDEAIKKSSAKYFKKGSIVLAMYGATIGKIGIATQNMTCNQACCVFDLSTFDNGKEYLYCWLIEHRGFLISQGKGAAQSNLSQQMIKKMNIVIPNTNLLKFFSEIMNPCFELKKKLQRKNMELIKSRNYLSIKLLSGELEV